MSMEQIRPSDARLRYLGRIDDENPDAPALHWVCTGLTFRVRARVLRLQVSNIHHFWENRLGVIVNGQASAILLPENGDMTIDLSEQLTGGADEILVFKRQDSCHAVVIRGLEIDGELLEAPEVPARRIEFYGDSVTAGEVSEAEHCCGQVDPPHNGQYSNSYLSYAWQTARLLGAEMHNQGQGGIALLDGTGYFNAPNYLGMLSSWDRVTYDPTFGPCKPWDFARWTPHVVVVAIGQNDAHPVNYMEADIEGEAAEKWRDAYAAFIRKLRAVYPRAHIILTTTILMHAPQWDESIERVSQQIRQEDARVHHFLYSRNGAGTPGHIRGSEAAEMAQELAAFIEGLPEVWS